MTANTFIYCLQCGSGASVGAPCPLCGSPVGSDADKALPAAVAAVRMNPCGKAAGPACFDCQDCSQGWKS